MQALVTNTYRDTSGVHAILLGAGVSVFIIALRNTATQVHQEKLQNGTPA